VYDREQACGGAESNGSVPSLLVPRGILESQQRIVEDGSRLFEGDPMFL
jgi:hypothetical protein